jgi:5-methyltetrahydropteroyltriglutamate--homocysteine methyltransferase
MKLISTNNGSYPRIGDNSDKQILRKTIALWEKGQKTPEDLREAENEMTRLAISEQVEAGLELVTDGLIRWYDPLSHIAAKLTGIKINGLLRFFDTNFYFRQPVVFDEIRLKEPIIVGDYLFARSASSRPVKPVLTGPFTLAKLSIVETDRYKDFESLLEAYTEAIANEVKNLAEAGAEIIQVDEPSILKSRQQFNLFSASVLKLNDAKRKAKLAVNTYFGDCTSLFESLQALPADILGIDFTYAGGLVDRISKDGSSKPLGLGLIDGRNTKLENETDLYRTLEMMLPKIGADISYLQPSCGLEYLPRDRAFQKLQITAKIAQRYTPS